MVWTGLIWPRIGTNEGSCEHGDEPSDSMKLLKKGSAPWSHFVGWLVSQYAKKQQLWRENLVDAAEEFPMIQTVTREGMVKTAD
jgi:hypothetical protein